MDNKETSKMIKVYIASAYTKGDVAINVKAQMDAANILIEHGYVPFVPLYSHFQHMAHPQPYKTWLALDLEWVKVCDCMLRLPGASKGADKEVEYAKEIGMPIFHSMDSLVKGML
jgi:hypothetical protein